MAENNIPVSRALEEIGKNLSKTNLVSQESFDSIAAEQNLTPEEIELLLAGMKNKGIGIREDAEPEEDEDIDDEDEGEEEGEGQDAPIDTYADDSNVVPNSLSLFFKSIRQYKLLTAEEEVDLAKKIEKGDEEAREKFILSNIRLVAAAAKKYTSNTQNKIPREDLISYGIEGLITAVNKFDYRKGCRFSTYASWWIRQTLSRNIAQYESSIRIPSDVKSSISKASRAGERIFQEKGRKATSEEISQALIESGEDKKKYSPEKIDEYFSYTQPISLDEKIKDDDTTSLVDMLADESSVPGQEDEIASKEDISLAMDKVLNDREKRMLSLYFGLDNQGSHTLEEVGKAEGVTRERARQIINEAKGKIKKFIIANDGPQESKS